MTHKILNLIVAFEIAFAADLLLLANQQTLPVLFFYVCTIVLWFILCRLIRLPLKIHVFLPFLLPALIALFIYLPWRITSPDMAYVSTDTGKGDVYSGKKVMLIVPHEDDDINIAGGILEQYAQYGSEVYVVFTTNGDYYGLGPTRIAEGISACEHMGVPEDHVIFLGYGDHVAADGLHLYNTAPGKVLTSHAGYAQTYGTESHPAYRSGRAYTSDNLLNDIESVILEYRPDTILCCDFDSHPDHRALTLSFDRAMGRILKAHPSYQPTVLKGYAYFSAWVSNWDFYTLNLLSTADIFASPFHQTPAVYEWENRVRLPVAENTLSRSLVNARAYAALQCYRSQGADKHASAIVNGDKVFWQRRTDSLLYRASVTASSGEAGLLNNFMLIDSGNILVDNPPPYKDTWLPSQDDHEKTVFVSFDQPTDVYEIALYDHPSPSDNVLNAVITFDNGAVIETGRLTAGGSACVIPVGQSGVKSFTVSLTEFEGHPGLTEIEAYAAPYSTPFSLIKLINQDGHFIYDYVIDRSGRECFSLYAFTEAAPDLSDEAFCVTVDNARCSAELTGGLLEVACPAGETCVVTISSRSDPALADSVLIRNPTALKRAVLHAMQKAEQFVHTAYIENYLERTAIMRTPEAITVGIPQALHDLHYLLYRMKTRLLSFVGLA